MMNFIRKNTEIMKNNENFLKKAIKPYSLRSYGNKNTHIFSKLSLLYGHNSR